MHSGPFAGGPGHIHIEVGIGEWPLGLALLQSLTDLLSWSAAPEFQLESA
ncbi:hypothetical protein [Limnohabitans sp. DM1]|nr:hypothetical protein [Limnohabitans sp. DM1]